MPVVPVLGAIGTAVTGGALAGTMAVVVGGAIVGAAVGAVVAAVTGGSILKGALLGAVAGGAVGFAANVVAPLAATGSASLISTTPAIVTGAEAGLVPFAPAAATTASLPVAGAAAAPVAGATGTGLTGTQQVLLAGAKGAAGMFGDDGQSAEDIADENQKDRDDKTIHVPDTAVAFTPPTVSQESTFTPRVMEPVRQTPAQVMESDFQGMHEVLKAATTPAAPAAAGALSPGVASVAPEAIGIGGK